MKYYIITALGTSERSYSSAKKTIHGKGQCAGVSMRNWLFTSVPIMETIKKTCEGYTLESPDGIIKWVKHILVLVDDAWQYVNDWITNDINQILRTLQDSSQTWEPLLNTTGEN